MGAEFGTHGSSVHVKEGAMLVFMHNIAGDNGGGLKLFNKRTLFWARDANTRLQFVNNTAGATGGGIAAHPGTVVEISAPSNFSFNRATIAGGAIGIGGGYLEDGFISCVPVTLINYGDQDTSVQAFPECELHGKRVQSRQAVSACVPCGDFKILYTKSSPPELRLFDDTVIESGMKYFEGWRNKLYLFHVPTRE